VTLFDHVLPCLHFRPEEVGITFQRNLESFCQIPCQIETKCSSETSVLTRTTWRHQITNDIILLCYRRGNIKSYIIVLFGRLIITFDKVASDQLYLHGNKQDNGDTFAWGCLLRPSWGTSSLKTKGTQDSLTLKIEEKYSSETSVLTIVTRRHIPEGSIIFCYRRENTVLQILPEHSTVHP
jgi:hypothetical protein